LAQSITFECRDQNFIRAQKRMQSPLEYFVIFGTRACEINKGAFTEKRKEMIEESRGIALPAFQPKGFSKIVIPGKLFSFLFFFISFSNKLFFLDPEKLILDSGKLKTLDEVFFFPSFSSSFAS